MPQDLRRETGILLPLWTLSHAGDLGIGDLYSLRAFLPWLAGAGLNFVQLLPVNETDRSSSPYSAISSVALDPIYLDLSQIPDAEIPPAPTRQGEPVNYPQVREDKARILRAAFSCYTATKVENSDFQKFREREAEWLEPYSIFRLLMQREGDSPAWEDWNPEYNTAAKARAWINQNLTEIEPELLYIQWLQWHCQTQWTEVNTYARSLKIKLMGDIPVGVSFNSADVFFESTNFDLEWSGGAPPETFFKDDQFAIKWGQNWGVPIYNDAYLKQTNFAWWKRRVRKHTEIFSMFRIDHILGLYRFYAFPWKPQLNASFLPLTHEQAKQRTGGKLPGFKPSADENDDQKATNLARGNEFITHIQEAAQDAKIIAEDLGVVPDYVRPHLLEKEIAGFRICHWEIAPDGVPVPPEQYSHHSFSTFSTHDHPPIPALWEEYRMNIASQDPDTRNDAVWNMKILCQIAQQDLPEHLESPSEVPAFSEEILWKMIDSLFQANSRYCAFMITDILGLPDRFNTPSTVGDHNWTYRLPFTVEEFSAEPDLKLIQRELSRRILARNER